MIPSGWKEVRLLDVIEIVSGQVDPKTSTYKEMPLVAPNHIETGTGRIIQFETANSQNAISGKYLAEVGDVLYSKIRPYLQKAAIVSQKCLCSADMYSFRTNGELDNRFLLHILLSKDFTQFAVACSGRTGIPKINREELGDFYLNLPPLSEQKKIADILSCWDRAIQLLGTLARLSEHFRVGLIQKLVFGKIRLNNINSAKDISYRYFSIPEDWKTKKICEIADEYSERNNIGVSSPVLSCTKHRGLVESKLYFGKQVYSDDLSNYKVAPRDSFVYATNHIEEGSIGYQSHFDNALVSPIYTVFKTNLEVSDGYLLRVLKTETFRHIFQASTNSSVDRRGSLRWKDFSQIEIPVPPMEEQIKISEVIDSCEKHKKAILLLRDQVVSQKQGLMQQLLTGKRRVEIS